MQCSLESENTKLNFAAVTYRRVTW